MSFAVCIHCKEGNLDPEKWHYCTHFPQAVACEKPRPKPEEGEKIKIERNLTKLYYFKPIYIDGLRAARYTIKYKQEPGTYIYYCKLCRIFHEPAYRYKPCLVNQRNFPTQR